MQIRPQVIPWKTAPRIETMTSDPNPATGGLGGWPSEARRETQKLRRENEELARRLADFAGTASAEGRTDQVPDGNIKKQFETVCFAIRERVTDIELDFARQSMDFRAVFQHIISDTAQRNLPFVVHIRGRERDNKKWDERMWWLGRQDSCIQVVLCSIIWASLYKSVFQGLCPLGVSDDAARGLSYIVSAMRDKSNGEGRNAEIAGLERRGLVLFTE